MAGEKNIPRHVGFIMDGNGRWAKLHGVRRIQGHQKGYEALRKIARWCKERGISVATFFAFSTENWKRPAFEVRYLMRLMGWVLRHEVPELLAEGVRIKVIGHRGKPLPKRLAGLIAKAEEQTAGAGDFVAQIAFNYGGKAEILAACRQCIRDGLRPEQVTEEEFTQRLWSGAAPPVDLIIRTAGDYRTSGFMLWQGAYSELCFPRVLWPDFSEEDLDKALAWYASRERRFGGRPGKSSG